MKLNIYKITLFFIFLIYIFFRIYKLDQIPYGFHRDEASIGYNAFSILTTGKDEWGKSFPLFIRAFGDYPPALAAYVTIPFIIIFGLSEFGVRFSMVFFSIVNFILLFKILTKLKFSKSIKILYLVLITISPWEISQARSSSEAILGAFFFLAGFNLFILFLKSKHFKHLFGFFICWLLTYFSYNSFRILIPLFTLLVCLIIKQTNIKISKIYYFLLMLLILMPLVISFINPYTNIKGQNNLFFNASNIPQSINVRSEQSALMGAPFFLTRIIYNKISYLLISFIKNIIEVVSLSYLYLVEANPRRYSVPDNGLFLYITIPFLILGIFQFLTSQIDKKIKLWLFISILICFLPTIITTGDFPNNRRSYLALFPLIFLIAYGWDKFIQKVNQWKLINIGTVILFIMNFIYFWFNYQFLSPYLVSHSRNYSYKQIADVINKNLSEYSKIKIYSYSEQPYIFILFFNKYDPLKYQQFEKTNLRISNDAFSITDNWGFDKFIFTAKECPEPESEELVFADINKCKILKEKIANNEWEIKGKTLSPYGSEEFVYYQLKNHINNPMK